MSILNKNSDENGISGRGILVHVRISWIYIEYAVCRGKGEASEESETGRARDDRLVLWKPHVQNLQCSPRISRLSPRNAWKQNQFNRDPRKGSSRLNRGS